MENLNAEQVKKALECYTTYNCDKCPVENRDCENFGCIKDALALINSQEQRIKELTEEIDELYRLVDDKIQENKRLTEENERLQKALNTDISIVRVCRGSGKTAHLREVGRIRADAIRADTVRKMQERFAVCFGTYTDKDMTPITEVFRRLDKIAKEMLEGEDG